MALTLDKTKAKELRKNSGVSGISDLQNKSLEIDFLPTEEELQEIKEKYKLLVKNSDNVNNVGKVMDFRVIDSNGSKYFILKSLSAQKKS